MTREEAIKRLEEADYNSDYMKEAIYKAIEALHDNKPSRTWIAKNEYRKGWHDAITKALAEVQKIYIANETFDMVQKETLIGLGLSMDSALGAEPYSETEESYPEPDRPHGEWKTEPHSTMIHCSNCGAIENLNRLYVSNFCYECGADMRPTSPSNDCMKRGEQIRGWILQGMREGETDIQKAWRIGFEKR